MEYFAMDPRILPLYAKHYVTGQPLPDEIIKSKYLCIKFENFKYFIELFFMSDRKKEM